MAERCGFFNATNSSNPDRVYDSSDFAAYFASFIGNGVFAKHSNQLRVAQRDSPAMSVQVLGGQAWINGWWYENTSPLNLSIDPADGTLDRIDIVVVQFDLTSREIKTIVRKGLPSAGATAPMLNRDDDLWELKLAEVNVSHGTVNITDGKIRDTRSNSIVCGWVSGLINQMDTTELFNQLKEATQDAVDAMNEALDGTTEGELKAYKKSLRLENNINAGANLNTFLTPGSYACTIANSASVTNKPDEVTGAFMLFVYKQQNGSAFQELFDMSKPDVYVRISDGKWKKPSDDIGDLLWQGTLTHKGTITVYGMSKYRLIAILMNGKRSIAFLDTKSGQKVVGNAFIDSGATDYDVTALGFDVEVSGDLLIVNNLLYYTMRSKGLGTPFSLAAGDATTINAVYGIA
jgi:hypothetical protein